MKKIASFILLLSVATCFGQKDSLELGEKYTEDQLYLSFTYNQLFNQPAAIGGSGFSYGFSAGFIKDIPFRRQGDISLGIGIGYGFDTFNHGLKVDKSANVYSFSIDNTINSNKFSIHTIEFPVEFRWRTSSAKKYKFWRIYTGVKFGYNLSNKFSYVDNGINTVFKNITNFKKFQYGLTISAGYDAFVAHLYYGLTPLLENASLGGNKIDTKMLKLGLIFYIL
jgi:hypothetical protein